MKKLIVFDGNSIVNRAFYGVKLLNTKSGIFTNAIFGFMNILFKFLNTENPDYAVVTFDLKAPTFRHKMYDGYKAQRKGMPQELAMQMPYLKEILAAMNIPMLSKEGYEADDLIGTVAGICKKEGIECIIATGDRDSLQLTDENVCVYLASPKNGGSTETVKMTPEAVFEKYGVKPKQLIEIKGLMGDSSDNIPGVAGVGEKTACKLISDYGTIDGVYEHIDEIKGALKRKLETGKEMAYLSRTLGTIDCNVPIDETLENFVPGEIDNDVLFELLKKLELKSIITKLGLTVPENDSAALSEKEETPEEEKETVFVKSEEELKTAISAINEQKEIFYKIFCGSTGIYAVGVMTDKKMYFCVVGSGLLTNFEPQSLKPLFESDAEKCTHSLKEDILLLRTYGIALKNVTFDTSLAAYVAEPSRSNYDLGSLCDFETEEDFFGKGKKRISPENADETALAKYALKCLMAQAALKKQYMEMFEKNQQNDLFFEMEMPLTTVLADMEEYGFCVDRNNLLEFGKYLEDMIELSEKKIYELAGEEFNINSTKQLGEILFEKLGLKVIRKTKTGYSTDSEVLEKLSGEHEIIEYIKNYRAQVKLKSTYVDGMLPLISPVDGRIHSKFNQTVTATGRISSTEPNLQNIPVRTPLGREMRKMFVAGGENYTLLDADYSQIELRVLAHIAEDETLISAFKSGDDIHTLTASQVFGVDKSEVTEDMRRSAKAVNFGIVYGISDFALAGDLKITKKMAKAYMDSYFETYNDVKKYMDSIVEKAKEDGYVETMFRRRRYIPELKSQKFFERAFGERVALNTPVQGTAADIIKMAMVSVHKRLNGMKSHLILQIHDELIVEAHKDEAEEVKKILRESMESAAKLSVPLVAEVNEGDSWYDAK